MWVPFHNRYGVICKLRKYEDEQLYVNVTKQPIFVSKRNSIEKETYEIFDCLGGFLYKVSIVKYGFSKSVFRDNYFFGRLEATFLANVYIYNKKPLLHLVETTFF